MYDQYNRKINYMRISLTDRCNLHCKYCRPQVAQHLEHRDILRYEEILRIARCAVALGITRFKITGGEPLVRKGAVDFIAQLKALSGVEQVTLTTNGVLLEQSLPQLLEAGIDGINISLDTLNPEYYRELTGGGEVEAVVSALKAAVNAGVRCKLNCVPLKNHELNMVKLVEFANNMTVPLRFIELMPLTCNSNLESYTGAELRNLLQKNGYALHYVSKHIGNGPAEYYQTEQGQLIGFIEPVHHKFCVSCNRVRLTSTGMLKPCLYSPGALDLRALLRKGVTDEELKDALCRAVYVKPQGHHFEEQAAGFSMNEIGG